MPDNGQIKTLYTDENHTQAVYPRTTASAVSGLGSIAPLNMTEVVSGANPITIQGELIGVDTTRVIQEYNKIGTTTSYTATEDCIALFWVSFYDGYPKLDNVSIFPTNSPGTPNSWMYLPLKEGQTLSMWANGYVADNYVYCKIYGLKRGNQ